MSRRDKDIARTQAAILPEDPTVLLDEYQVAKRESVSVDKLRQDRHRGTGIPYLKFGGTIRYCVDDIERYRTACIRFSTKEGK